MQPKQEKRLVLVELNEINLDYARHYAECGNLPNLKRILAHGLRCTSSEERYEELEPWIQWVSVHTGKTAAQHGISRLGDIVGSQLPQFFETVEASGYSVGSITAMNAENRLRRPAYFIPDPWTATPTDGSFWSRMLGEAISQAVNDNAQERLSSKSVLALLGGLVRFARPSNYLRYLKLVAGCRAASWRKALFLDLFLHDLHLRLFRRRMPNFSTVFFNAGAHIQHHYLFNARQAVKTGLHNPGWYISAEQDPFGEMLSLYDGLLGDYLAMEDVDLIVATGLSQQLYDRVKYYWRLKSHEVFLRRIGVAIQSVHPRMTRDLLIEFESREAAARGAARLAALSCVADGKPVFGLIDNRGDSLFVTLTYSGPMNGETMVRIGGDMFDLRPYVAFVAIKNGMHRANGFVYYKGRVAEYAARDGMHVKELHNVVLNYFGVSPWDGTSDPIDRPALDKADTTAAVTASAAQASS